MGEKRVVAENHDFIAVTPYAPKAPFEVWLLPKKHESSFEDIAAPEVQKPGTSLFPCPEEYG